MPLARARTRLSHLWQLNFSNFKGAKKVEWRNSNWLVFDSTICNELPKKHLRKRFYICSLKFKKELEMRSTFKILFYTNKGKEKDSIPTIPSMTLLRKNLEGECKTKRSEGRDCKCLSIGAPCNLLEHSFQCFIVKDCNKKLRNFCFCI